jgi:hypothetical protein
LRSLEVFFTGVDVEADRDCDEECDRDDDVEREELVDDLDDGDVETDGLRLLPRFSLVPLSDLDPVREEEEGEEDDDDDDDEVEPGELVSELEVVLEDVPDGDLDI